MLPKDEVNILVKKPQLNIPSATSIIYQLLIHISLIFTFKLRNVVAVMKLWSTFQASKFLFNSSGS